MILQIDELCEHLYEDLEMAVTQISSQYDQQNYLKAIVFTLECYDWRYGKMGVITKQRRRFTITCQEPREHTLSVGGTREINFLKEHALLYEHNDVQSSLYFSSAPNNPYEVLGRLSEAHQSLFHDWRPMERYFNLFPEGQFIPLLRRGNGLLARAARTAISLYSSAVENCLAIYSHENYAPQNKFCLLLLDTGYVICQRIVVRE